VRGHPPQILPGVYRFFLPAYSRAPPLHIARARTPFSWRYHHSVVESASYYVQPPGDNDALCSLSPSFRTCSEGARGA